MDTLKEVVSFLGAIIGFITALVTLYAFYLDRKNRREAEGRKSTAFPDSPPLTQTWQPPPRQAKAAVAVLDVLPVLPEYPKDTRRAQQMVKVPAILLIVVGFLSLGFNLLAALWGFVDTFVTPLNQEQPKYTYNAPRAYPAPYGQAPVAPQPPRKTEEEKMTGLLTCFTLLSFGVASLIAIWAGFNMIRLRSYWLSVAGSCAIMPGACFCCLAGLPVGVWSITVLMNSEVSSAFT